jgi:hypothetical protein
MKPALRVVALLLLVVVVAGLIIYRYPLWVADQHTRFHLWRRGVKSEYVEAGGYRLHYFEAGPGLHWCWCMGWARGARTGAR